ncbi:hypothetical protein P154DRAFT_582517 [Amniculicola lignicola CBS 123094]|uniref:Uncharacterized protein n=1 Tax=Amniculicola lignicola CBS 123094 TaxID=1392246 RepID=A0A6A5VXS9_9PLEO|nr:hypothetical protein P154DRAFT_582517 [Amniculicola lignicola CBS 123094]
MALLRGVGALHLAGWWVLRADLEGPKGRWRALGVRRLMCDAQDANKSSAVGVGDTRGVVTGKPREKQQGACTWKDEQRKARSVGGLRRREGSVKRRADGTRGQDRRGGVPLYECLSLALWLTGCLACGEQTFCKGAPAAGEPRASVQGRRSSQQTAPPQTTTTPRRPLRTRTRSTTLTVVALARHTPFRILASGRPAASMLRPPAFTSPARHLFRTSVQHHQLP